MKTIPMFEVIAPFAAWRQAVMPLTRLRPQLGLAVGMGDALFRRHFFDERRPPRKAFQHILGNARNLEIIPLALDAEA
jgi:hypothetical protein